MRTGYLVLWRQELLWYQLEYLCTSCDCRCRVAIIDVDIGSTERVHNCEHFADRQCFAHREHSNERSFSTYRRFRAIIRNRKQRTQHRCKGWYRRWCCRACDTTCNHRVPFTQDEEEKASRREGPGHEIAAARVRQVRKHCAGIPSRTRGNVCGECARRDRW
jgi:hypothetical protein